MFLRWWYQWVISSISLVQSLASDRSHYKRETNFSSRISSPSSPNLQKVCKLQPSTNFPATMKFALFAIVLISFAALALTQSRQNTIRWGNKKQSDVLIGHYVAIKKAKSSWFSSKAVNQTLQYPAMVSCIFFCLKKIILKNSLNRANSGATFPPSTSTRRPRAGPIPNCWAAVLAATTPRSCWRPRKVKGWTSRLNCTDRSSGGARVDNYVKSVIFMKKKKCKTHQLVSNWSELVFFCVHPKEKNAAKIIIPVLLHRLMAFLSKRARVNLTAICRSHQYT